MFQGVIQPSRVVGIKYIELIGASEKYEPAFIFHDTEDVYSIYIERVSEIEVEMDKDDPLVLCINTGALHQKRIWFDNFEDVARWQTTIHHLRQLTQGRTICPKNSTKKEVYNPGNVSLNQPHHLERHSLLLPS